MKVYKKTTKVRIRAKIVLRVKADPKTKLKPRVKVEFGLLVSSSIQLEFFVRNYINLDQTEPNIKFLKRFSFLIPFY